MPGEARDLNVLFVTADQWRGDCLGGAGHPVVRTPNLDRLAAGGVSFRRHFAQAAPCGPSRASLYTGMYLMNHRSVLNGTPLDARHTNVALRRPRAGLRARAVRLHRHERRPAHGRPRRSAPPLLRRGPPGLRPGVRPARRQPGALARLDARRRESTCPTTGGPSSTTRPRAPAGRPSTTPSTRQTVFLTDRLLDFVDDRSTRGHAVVRAPLLSAAAPAVPRARAVRHDVRPRVGSRRRCARRRVPRRARSTRCSA